MIGGERRIGEWASHPPEGTARVPVLGIRGVTKSFGGLQVLQEVSLAVQEGEIFGLAGPNGAGKTTLFNIVTGFDSPDSGIIWVGNDDVTGLNAYRLSKYGLGRTFQNIRLFPGLTVHEQVRAGAFKHRRASLLASLLKLPQEGRDRVLADQLSDEAIEFVGLTLASSQLSETLSYGDQRRVEIARALAGKPRVLLLDEPTAGMNEADWNPIAELLLKLRNDGITVVVVEHNLRLLRQCCDRVAVLATGQIIALDVPSISLDLPAVRKAYFGR